MRKKSLWPTSSLINFLPRILSTSFPKSVTCDSNTRSMVPDRRRTFFFTMCCFLVWIILSFSISSLFPVLSCIYRANRVTQGQKKTGRQEYYLANYIPWKVCLMHCLFFLFSYCTYISNVYLSAGVYKLGNRIKLPGKKIKWGRRKEGRKGREWN